MTPNTNRYELLLKLVKEFKVDGVVDIGGQDSKVIQIHNNKVINFLMNDKCAAGTGRFLSMACETLEIGLLIQASLSCISFTFRAFCLLSSSFFLQ